MVSAKCYEEVIHCLGELHKKLRLAQNQILEEYQISLMEYHILIIINQGEQVSQNELAARLNVDKALISRHIQSMEKKGLIYGEFDPSCRRKKTLLLSMPAKELIPQLQEAYSRCLVHIFSDITQQELQEFQSIIERLVIRL